MTEIGEKYRICYERTGDIKGRRFVDMIPKLLSVLTKTAEFKTEFSGGMLC